MDTQQETQQTLQISPENLLAFVQAVIGISRERPSDEDPLPRGPWDPSIRAALDRVDAFGPPPEPWMNFAIGILARKHPEIFDILGGGHNIGDDVALNPQPLPPRIAFLESLVQTVVSRAELLQEITDATSQEGEQQGIIIVSGYISRFIDEFCGTGFRMRFPHPGPRPRWFPQELGGIDLLVMAAYFDQAAKETFTPVLRENLTGASAKLLDAAVLKMR